MDLLPTVMISTSQLDLVEEAVDVLGAVVPEEHDLALGDLLGPGDHQLDYIVETPTGLEMMMGTYLLLCGSFRGFTSAFLNQAKYSSHGATL